MIRIRSMVVDSSVLASPSLPLLRTLRVWIPPQASHDSVAEGVPLIPAEALSQAWEPPSSLTPSNRNPQILHRVIVEEQRQARMLGVCDSCGQWNVFDNGTSEQIADQGVFD